MKAAILEQVHKPLVIDHVEIRNPGPNEILLRTAAVGLCHSDLHYIEGTSPCPLPIILGHEPAAIVEKVGSDVTTVAPGDHVVGCLSAFCGRCDYCTTGEPVLCESVQIKPPPGTSRALTRRGVHINHFHRLSAFAEQMLVHENAVVKIRKDMPLDRAALLGCCVLTGIGSVFRTVKLEPGSTVAIVGCGGVGLSSVMGAALAGALHIIAVDRVAEKLDLAKNLGATHTVDASKCDAVDEVLALTKGGVRYSFECIGLKETAEQCFKMLAPGGTATLMGVMPVGLKLEFAGRDLFRQRQVRGSVMGSNRFTVDIPRLVEFYMQARLPLDKLISRRLPLEQINRGFEDLKSGAVARSVIEFSV